MAGFFPQFAFPFPPINQSLLFLKFFPSTTMPINLVFPTPSASYNEVWGMDNQDFYESDPQELVRLGDVS